MGAVTVRRSPLWLYYAPPTLAGYFFEGERLKPNHQYDRDRSSLVLKVQAIFLAAMMIGSSAAGLYSLL